ncbi:hypothetical protein A3844_05580 [Paenibacillus helianthi]|uniref:Uncharacterized protein n=1 Tax=Paenibacillus helianthi TaxID=1349432 RepID=A0ABX3ES85_9BACL|nr:MULTISPECIES: hypothetical protein [Paenibacillus]OKP90361.1 hypothetical protein A3848_11590 [Paenibacillus sp. P32E]OKP90497.1 hypothetical protein A3844_05580 [Paenibacillus helianthi]
MTLRPSSESIMVCVHYGPHGQRLIQRGSQLSKLLSAPLCVLTVDSSKDNEYNHEKEQYLSGWETGEAQYLRIVQGVWVKPGK